MAEESGVDLCKECRHGDTGTYYSTAEGLITRHQCSVLGGQVSPQGLCEVFDSWVKELEGGGMKLLSTFYERRPSGEYPTVDEVVEALQELSKRGYGNKTLYLCGGKYAVTRIEDREGFISLG